MKKTLLALSLATFATMSVSADITASFDWSTVATVGSSKQTTSYPATILADGSMIQAYTMTGGQADFKLNGEAYALNDEGTVQDNLALVKVSANGAVQWTMNTTWGRVAYGSHANAVLSGSDLALIAFKARTNAKGDVTENLVKVKDATGKVYSLPYPAEYGGNADFWPYITVLMTYKPSDGSIVSLKAVESVYTTAVEGKYCTDPLSIEAITATSDAFYFTGYASTKTTFADGVVYEPTKTAADWAGGTGSESSFVVKCDATGTPVKVVADDATDDAYNKSALIAADGASIYVVGGGNTKVYGFMYDKNLNKQVALVYPLSLPTKGNSVCLLKGLDVYPGALYVTGHLAGGFEGTNIATGGESGDQMGFVVKIDLKTGKIAGGGCEPAKISGYYGAYEDGDGGVWAVGYNMTQKVLFIQPYSSTWEKAERVNLATSNGSPVMFGSSFNRSTNKLTVAARSNQSFVLGETVLTSGYTVFSGAYINYTIGGMTNTGVDSVVANEEGAVEYYNLQGVRVESPSNGLYIKRQGGKATKVLVK